MIPTEIARLLRSFLPSYEELYLENRLRFLFTSNDLYTTRMLREEFCGNVPDKRVQFALTPLRRFYYTILENGNHDRGNQTVLVRHRADLTFEFTHVRVVLFWKNQSFYEDARLPENDKTNIIDILTEILPLLNHRLSVQIAQHFGVSINTKKLFPLVHNLTRLRTMRHDGSPNLHRIPFMSEIQSYSSQHIRQTLSVP